MKPMTDFLRRNWRLLLFAGLAAMGTRWWVRQTQPERLSDISKLGYTHLVHEGQLYSAPPQPVDGHLNIWKRSVTDSRGRIIVHLPVPQSLSFTIDRLMVHEGSLYFTVAQRGSSSGLISQPRPLKAKPAAPGQPASSRFLIQPSWQSATLYRVPTSGGTPQPILQNLHNTQVAFIGQNVYWIDARPGEMIYLRNGQNLRRKTTEASRLMTTSLQNGATRPLAEGLPCRATLLAGKENIYWLADSSEATLGENDLWRYHPGLSAPQRIVHGIRATLPQEAGGRLYWVEIEGESLKAPFIGMPRIRRADLMSARTDGSDRRVALSLMENGEQKREIASLKTYRDSLYGQVWPQSLNRLPTEATLCRLRPAEKMALELLCKMPKAPILLGFDDGYAYYTVEEKLENLFDWKAPATHITALYRYRLPG